MRRVGLRHDQQSGRVSVDAMDDAGPHHAADARQRGAAMGDQRVDQRACVVAGGRMHHHADRLVDDDQVLVFKDDIERDRLAAGLGRSGRRHVDPHALAGAQFRAGIDDN